MRSTIMWTAAVLLSLSATPAYSAPVIHGALAIVNPSNTDAIITVSGQDLGNPGAGQVVLLALHDPDALLGALPTCTDSSPVLCQVEWSPQRIVFRLSPINLPKRIHVFNVSTGQYSEPAALDHYELRWFDSAMQNVKSPSQLAIDTSEPSASPEPPRRLFGDYEFHSSFQQLNPAVGSVNNLPIGRASDPIFQLKLIPNLPPVPSHIAQNAEEMITDPYGRVWFTDGGSYGAFAGDEHNHSRIVRFDPSNGEYCIYNVPGNNNDVMGIAYEKDAPTGTDRVWFVETMISSGNGPRLTWFDPDATFCDASDGRYAYRDDPATCDSGTCNGAPDRPCAADSDCMLGAPTQKCFDGVCQEDTTPCSVDANCPITPVASCPANSNEAGCVYHYYAIPGAFDPAQVVVDSNHVVWITGYWAFIGFVNNIWRLDPYVLAPTFISYPLHPGTWEIEAAPVLPAKTHPDIIVTSQASPRLDIFDSSRWGQSTCLSLVGSSNPCATTINLPDVAYEIALDRNRRIWFTGGAATIGYVEHQSKQVIRLPSLSVFPFELAERKEAKQSTTSATVHDASRAVDGNLATYSDTNLGTQWWRVDLRRPVRHPGLVTGKVGKVKIWVNPIATANYTVQILNENEGVIASQPTGPLSPNMMNQVTLTFADAEVRYVRISSSSGTLKLNEVQVLSVDPVADGAPAIAVDVSNDDVWFSAYRRRSQIGRLRPSRMNLGLGKTATQSPGIFGGAHLAVDGDIFGAMTSTLNLPEPYWQVDLQRVKYVTDVNVWGCPPGQANCPTLQDFKVVVSDSPITSTDLSYLCSSVPSVQCYSVSGPVGRPSTVAVNRTARYVRVQVEWPTPQQQTLRLAEVEVMGSLGACPASCNDGNPCTEDVCRQGQCDHIAIIGSNPNLNGTGAACSGSTTCQNIMGEVCCTDAVWKCVADECGFWTASNGLYIDDATYFTLSCP